MRVVNKDLTRNANLSGGGRIEGTGTAAVSGTVTAAAAVPLVTLASVCGRERHAHHGQLHAARGTVTRVTGSGEVILPAASTYAARGTSPRERCAWTIPTVSVQRRARRR
jgi:hypothetical protein